jgi:mono/diheme cytochrome c family protein
MTRSAVIAIAVVAAACGDWPWRHEMVNQPSRSMSATARPAVDGTIARSAQRPTVGRQASPPNDAGRALYASYCVPCHGVAGEGDGPVGRYFGTMRALTDSQVQQHDDSWLFDAITNGTDRMPRYSHELTLDERWRIVQFLRYMGAAR